MSEMSVNWGELMAGGAAEFQPVPKGNYDVVVDTAEPKQSTTGKLMFALKFKIQGGPQAGRTIFNNITLTTDNPNALRYFFLNMKAMGIGQDFFAQNPSPSVIAQALIGQPCRVEIDHRPYQGSMRENVKSISPAGGTFAGGAITGPSAPVSSPMIPAPGATVGPVPSMPQPSSSPLPVAVQPQPVAPVQPAPAPVAPQAAPVAETVSTAAIPQPVNPAPAAEEPAPAADPTPALPPGFTDQAQYDAFMAFQRAQAAEAAPAAAPAPAAQAPSSVPPPLPF